MMNERAYNRLHDSITRLVSKFDGNPDTAARLIADAQADIEQNERDINSQGALDRAVAAARKQLQSEARQQG